MPGESTTPELEERVRRAIEAERRDLEASVAFFAPDAVWDTSLPQRGHQRGSDREDKGRGCGNSAASVPT